MLDQHQIQPLKWSDQPRIATTTITILITTTTTCLAAQFTTTTTITTPTTTTQHRVILVSHQKLHFRFQLACQVQLKGGFTLNPRLTNP